MTSTGTRRAASCASSPGSVSCFGAVVGGLILYRGGSWSVALGDLGRRAVVAVVGLASPTLMRPIYMGWMAAAFPIGWTVSQLVLAATFYVVVTPIGLLLRLAAASRWAAPASFAGKLLDPARAAARRGFVLQAVLSCGW